MSPDEYDDREDPAAVIAELRRRLYSRASADDPQRAAADRARLDRLERERDLAAAREQELMTSRAVALPPPKQAGLRAEIPVQDGSDAGAPGDRDPRSARPRSGRKSILVGATFAVAILGAAGASWVIVTAPPSADAITIFDRPGTLADTSAFPPDYRLAGGSGIEQIRSLGTFDGWEAWATRQVDGQICLIAVQDQTTAATCATPEQFAGTGLTLGVTGVKAVSGNAAPQRDLMIMWGPDDLEASTSDGGN